jgi:hypothetical protein
MQAKGEKTSVYFFLGKFFLIKKFTSLNCIEIATFSYILNLPLRSSKIPSKFKVF